MRFLGIESKSEVVSKTLVESLAVVVPFSIHTTTTAGKKKLLDHGHMSSCNSQ
jgi:hypothetical protein